MSDTRPAAAAAATHRPAHPATSRRARHARLEPAVRRRSRRLRRPATAARLGPPGSQPAYHAGAAARPCAAAEYHLILRGGRPGWWRHVVGAVSLVAMMYVVAPFVVSIPFVIWFAPTAGAWPTSSSGWSTSTTPTPIGLAYLNLAARLGDPGHLAADPRPPRAQAALAGLGAAADAVAATCSPASGWRSSRCSPRSWSSALLPAQDTGTEMSGAAQRLHEHHPRLPAGGAVPHAAAGRGGGVRLPRLPRPGVRRPVPQPDRGRRHPRRPCSRSRTASARAPPIFFDRFAFGLVAGMLVILTGGLEAGIAMHVLNNWLAFGIALAFGDTRARR